MLWICLQYMRKWCKLWQLHRCHWLSSVGSWSCYTDWSLMNWIFSCFCACICHCGLLLLTFGWSILLYFCIYRWAFTFHRLSGNVSTHGVPDAAQTHAHGLQCAHILVHSPFNGHPIKVNYGTHAPVRYDDMNENGWIAVPDLNNSTTPHHSTQASQ